MSQAGGMRGLLCSVGVAALAVHIGACGGAYPNANTASTEWETQLERRCVRALDPVRSAVTIKRDVHNLDIDVDAGLFADAFHRVMMDPRRRFGLIKVDRMRANIGQPFHVGERFQGRYELDEAIRRDLHGWLAKLFGDLLENPEVQELVHHIENGATSDYGMITQLDLHPAPGKPYVIAYQYLEGTPIAGSSTFTVIPLEPGHCRLTQIFEYQESSVFVAAFFSTGGLKLHDQVVTSQAMQAAELAGGHIETSDIPAEYTSPMSRAAEQHQ